mmetsp:Transcript_210/g.451  ORF Transcript_210/g.451 Transcript_210/m.451 type:complete len:248 (+) Transcript_210:3121-3864(+)
MLLQKCQYLSSDLCNGRFNRRFLLHGLRFFFFFTFRFIIVILFFCGRLGFFFCDWFCWFFFFHGNRNRNRNGNRCRGDRCSRSSSSSSSSMGFLFFRTIRRIRFFVFLFFRIVFRSFIVLFLFFHHFFSSNRRFWSSSSKLLLLWRFLLFLNRNSIGSAVLDFFLLVGSTYYRCRCFDRLLLFLSSCLCRFDFYLDVIIGGVFARRHFTTVTAAIFFILVIIFCRRFCHGSELICQTIMFVGVPTRR